jgi:uncharacterized membrane protein YfcA
MLLISLGGGLAGALLLLATSERAFDALLPWLLLIGTLVFAFGRQLGAALRRWVAVGPGPCWARRSCSRSTPATSAAASAS